MKNSFSFLLLLLLPFYGYTQFEKSLLWEISGNGLTKKSYVYGTYHVNEKLSYHLTDEFYKYLLEADIVSNESNPHTWGELFDLYFNNISLSKPNFYEGFIIKPIDKQQLQTLFFNPNFFNQMSSGVDGNRADYSENTVLDMFIFQTAKKYNKKTIGLEDAKKSFINISKSEMQRDYFNDDEQESLEEETRKIQLSKILKDKPLITSLKDFYRDKDIVMLDSLSKLSSKPKKHRVMIINRNYDMVKSIDSLMHQGSLFSAIGAAHLSGKEGVLQLLINKGYKVSPIIGKLTKKGETDKKTIEEYFPNPKQKTEVTRDKMVQSVSFDLDLNFQNVKSTLDITNGGVLTINRIPLRNYLKKKSDYFNPKSIDSLFYEFIPGEILEKTEIKEETFLGYDIKNKSKTGNYQHFRFYITPLEIIGVNYIGSGNYVKQYEQSIFNQLKIKQFKKAWEKVSPEKGGFSVQMPDFCVQYGNNVKGVSDVTFEAFDPDEKSYYFLIENSSSDFDFYDERNFQHQQIQNEFYISQEMEETAKFTQNTIEFTSQSSKNDRKIQLKSFINGNKFYLLGAVDASEKSSKKFFDSFKEEAFTTLETITYKDTLRKFEIEIPKKINERTILGINEDDSRYEYSLKMKDDNYLRPKDFCSHTGKKVTIDIQKYPRYFREVNIDSIKHDYNESLKIYYDTFKPEENDNPFLSTWDTYFKAYEKTEVLKNIYCNNKELDCEVSEALVSSKNSNQALKIKTFLMNNRKATIKAVVDRNYKNDDMFIEKAFEKFNPNKTNDKGVFDDKVDLFLEEASSDKDSIRKIALFNIYNLSLQETDFEKVTRFIDTTSFKDSDLNLKAELLKKLGELKTLKVATYLEAKYKAENSKTTEQVSILNALANQNTKSSYLLILKLMEFDLPVTKDRQELNQLFNVFIENINESKVLFPYIFQFYGIEEYNDNIIRFCNELLTKNLGSSKKITAFQKLILTHSKLEYKRILNRQETIAANDNEEYAVADVDEYYEDDETKPYTSLLNYLSLLFHMPKNKDSDDLIGKIKKIDNPEFQLEILKLEIEHNKATNEGIKKLLENPETKFQTVLLLQGKDSFNLLSQIKDEEIAESAMYHFDKLKDNTIIQFLEKKEETKDEHSVVFYFYQTQQTKEGKNIGGKTFNSIVFVTANGKIIPKAYLSPVVEDINEENTIEKIKKIIVKEALYSDHPETNFRKNKLYNNFYDNYEY